MVLELHLTRCYRPDNLYNSKLFTLRYLLLFCALLLMYVIVRFPVYLSPSRSQLSETAPCRIIWSANAALELRPLSWCVADFCFPHCMPGCRRTFTLYVPFCLWSFKTWQWFHEPTFRERSTEIATIDIQIKLTLTYIPTFWNYKILHHSTSSTTSLNWVPLQSHNTALYHKFC